jgi:hypothetical protein
VLLRASPGAIVVETLLPKLDREDCEFPLFLDV